MEVWLIEDDRDVADLVSAALSESGFDVRVIASGTEARELLGKFAPDLVLVDWNLPGVDGKSVCTRARRLHPRLPIIMLTVRDDSDDIVEGLRSGADDYVTKPFDMRVLRSRIEALLRRTAEEAKVLRCDGIRLEVDQARAFAADDPLDLTPTEYRLLHLLMRNKGRIVTRDAMREELWGIDGDLMNDNSLTVAIKRLRAKLGEADCIKTVRSFGYRMEERA